MENKEDCKSFFKDFFAKDYKQLIKEEKVYYIRKMPEYENGLGLAIVD